MPSPSAASQSSVVLLLKMRRQTSSQIQERSRSIAVLVVMVSDSTPVPVSQALRSRLTTTVFWSRSASAGPHMRLRVERCCALLSNSVFVVSRSVPFSRRSTYFAQTSLADQYSFLIPFADARCLYCWENLDNRERV